jgi:hypothetical protein
MPGKEPQRLSVRVERGELRMMKEPGLRRVCTRAHLVAVAASLHGCEDSSTESHPPHRALPAGGILGYTEHNLHAPKMQHILYGWARHQSCYR